MLANKISRKKAQIHEKKKRARAFSEFLVRAHRFGNKPLPSIKAPIGSLNSRSADSFKEYAKARIIALEKEKAERLEHTKKIEDMLAALQSERNDAKRRANRAESLHDSQDIVIDLLEKENVQLERKLDYTRKELKQLETALANTKEWNRTLQNKLKDRTEVLIRIEKEKNRMIYQTNQQLWLREETESKLRNLEKEHIKSLVAQEHETAAMHAVLSQWETENGNYKYTIKELRSSLESRQHENIVAKKERENITIRRPSLLNKLRERTSRIT